MIPKPLCYLDVKYVHYLVLFHPICPAPIRRVKTFIPERNEDRVLAIYRCVPTLGVLGGLPVTVF